MRVCCLHFPCFVRTRRLVLRFLTSVSCVVLTGLLGCYETSVCFYKSLNLTANPTPHPLNSQQNIFTKFDQSSTHRQNWLRTMSPIPVQMYLRPVRLQMWRSYPPTARNRRVNAAGQTAGIHHHTWDLMWQSGKTSAYLHCNVSTA